MDNILYIVLFLTVSSFIHHDFAFPHVKQSSYISNITGIPSKLSRINVTSKSTDMLIRNNIMSHTTDATEDAPKYINLEDAINITTDISFIKETEKKSEMSKVTLSITKDKSHPKKEDYHIRYDVYINGSLTYLNKNSSYTTNPKLTILANNVTRILMSNDSLDFEDIDVSVEQSKKLILPYKFQENLEKFSNYLENGNRGGNPSYELTTVQMLSEMSSPLLNITNARRMNEEILWQLNKNGGGIPLEQWNRINKESYIEEKSQSYVARPGLRQDENEPTTKEPDSSSENTSTRTSIRTRPTLKRRTAPRRFTYEERCDYIAYYCMKAFQTSSCCGRTTFLKTVYVTFKNYCMLDYVNCMERYEIWQLIHMGECYIKEKTEVLLKQYNFYSEEDVDNTFLYESVVEEDKLPITNT